MNRARVCRRCGGCCQAHVGMLARRADFLRWRREGRGDILRVIAAAEAPVDGGLGDTAYLGACPFLVREGDRHACAIYESRPRACRDFQPGGSRCLGDSQAKRPAAPKAASTSRPAAGKLTQKR